MSSESKKKFTLNKREQRKTGGGSLPFGAQITPMDEKIEGIIGQTSITGVEGGNDLLDESTTTSSAKSTNNPSSIENTDNDEQAAMKVVPAKRKRRCDAESEDSTSKLVHIEQERLLLEKRRLHVEEDPLEVERKRLEIEEERLKLQKEKHNLYLCQMGIISSLNVSVQPEAEKALKYLCSRYRRFGSI